MNLKQVQLTKGEVIYPFKEEGNHYLIYTKDSIFISWEKIQRKSDYENPRKGSKGSGGNIHGGGKKDCFSWRCYLLRKAKLVAEGVVKGRRVKQ